MARRSQGKKKATKNDSPSPFPGPFETGARPFAFDFRIALILVGLVALTITTLWPVSLCKFVNYDDPIWVTANHRVQQGLGLGNIAWAFAQAYGYWTPIDVLSHMLDCQLFGLNPAGHHVTNLLIHTCNVVLLFLFLLRASPRDTTARPWRSALVAALFAVHPLNVEPVAWITGRKDVLSTFWAFLALLAYARYADSRPPRSAASWRRYLLVTVLFILSLMTKPALLPFPIVLLLIDYWPLKRFEGVHLQSQEDRKQIRGLLVEKVPLLCTAFVFVALDYVTQRHYGAVLSGDSGLIFRAANAAHFYLMYLWKAVWPAVLATPYSPRVPIALWKTTLTLLLLAGITVCAVVYRKRCPYLFAGWFWYGLILFPVCGLFVMVGDFAMADRYAYVSMIGLFAAVAWGLGEIPRGRGTRGRIASITVAGISVVAILAFAAVARSQVSYWHDDKTLFSHAIAVGQESSVAYNNLGGFAQAQGRYDEAKAYLTKAADLNPEYIDAFYNLGLIALYEKRYDEAKDYLTKTLNLNPDYVDALNNMGGCLINQGKYEEAERYLRKALEIDPQLISALNNLGVVLANLGRQEEADAYFKKAAELRRAASAK